MESSSVEAQDSGCGCQSEGPRNKLTVWALGAMQGSGTEEPDDVGCDQLVKGLDNDTVASVGCGSVAGSH